MIFKVIKEETPMFETIRQILVDTLSLDAAAITPEASLTEDLDVDSLAAVELAMELESTFDITIEDEEIAALKSVNDIIALVEGKQ